MFSFLIKLKNSPLLMSLLPCTGTLTILLPSGLLNIRWLPVILLSVQPLSSIILIRFLGDWFMSCSFQLLRQSTWQLLGYRILYQITIVGDRCAVFYHHINHRFEYFVDMLHGFFNGFSTNDTVLNTRYFSYIFIVRKLSNHYPKARVNYVHVILYRYACIHLGMCLLHQ